MTKIAISPNVNGTGTFTLAAPNSNTNRTLTLPDAGGEVLTDTSDIEAQVKTATSATGAAPIFACRAFVNFNGTGTIAIRGSGNVSSITDFGVGNYRVNFTTAMPDATYTPVASSHFSATATRGAVFAEPFPENASACRITTTSSSSSFDAASVTVAIFR